MRRQLSSEEGPVQLGPAYEESEQDDGISDILNQTIPVVKCDFALDF